MCRFCWQAISLLADWLQCFKACVQASLKKVSSCLWARMSFIKDWTFWGPSLIYQLLNQGFLFWPVLLNVSQPCASSSGCLVFSSLVLFFVSFPSVINLHPFFWSLTLCVYSLHSVRIQGKHRFLKLFFHMAPLSLGLCCTISVSPSLFQLQSLPSQLREITILLIGYPSLCCSQEMVPRQKSRGAAGLTSLVSLLSDFIVLYCMPPTVCLHLNMWNNSFTFWSSSLVYGMRVTQS